MECRTVINQGSQHTLNVAFFDEDGLAIIPQTATYEVWCMTNEIQIRAATAISPLTASVDITLAASDNTLQDPQENEREKRRVIVRSTNSNGDPYVDAYDYQIKRLVP